MSGGQSLERELAELERSNPAVKAAADKYHAAVRSILANQAAKETDPKEQAPCCAAKRDDHGRYPIGFCGPDCERRVQR